MIPTSLRQVWDNAQRLGRQDWLVLPDHRYSFDELTAGIRAFAAYCDHIGLQKGDRVLIVTAQPYAVALSFIASVAHGLVPVPLATDTGADRLATITSSTAPSLIITDNDMAHHWPDAAQMLLAEAPQKARLLRRAPAKHWPFATPWSDSTDPALPDDPAGLAYLMFTSGSTGAPSGVMLSRGNFLSNPACVGETLQINRGDRLFNDLPLSHTDGLMHGPVLGWIRGATIVRSAGFTVAGLEDWLNTVAREGCTHVLAVPYIWSLIDTYAAHDDYFDSPSIKMLIATAAYLQPALWDRIETRFGKPVVSEYGLTETVMSALHAGDFATMGTPRTLGRSPYCDVRIVPVADDDPSVGELLIKGPNVCLGYWNDDARTQASFAPDGWFCTGDIARARADGSYDFVGRSKAMIKSAGETIIPDEIDDVLMAHPAVRAVVTLGLPSGDFGEIAVSAVELEDPVETGALMDHARRGLEARKVPKHIVILPEIPRGRTGKPEIGRTRDMVAVQLETAQPAATAPQTQSSSANRVLDVAARTFMCDRAEISLLSGPDDIAGWDSFSHINMILAMETEFAMRIPTKKVTAILTLGDVAALVPKDTA